MFILNHAALRDATLAPSKSLVFSALILGLSVFSLQTQAGRPMLTDDATLADQCQLESWWQSERSGNSLWLAPACQLAGVEWGFAVARTASGEPQQYQVAAKTELKSLSANSFGITAQLAYEFAAGQHQYGDMHLNLALTQSWQDDAWLLHLNAGRMQRNQQSNDWTAGIALQRELAANQWLFVELHREQAGRPLYQLGYLQEVLPGRLQLDASYGNRLHRQGREDFVSAGAVLYFNLF
ncbi:hypothetical protein Q3O60_06335 [Alkalimonas collagenimarina]|uniref:Copper resistance protein B n=1 Tax=Alkalimonas collagenimarina TaxID=400390 RepID=A0ABT9GXM6_9GAMM|nr:hypothetical protein [Alkalimonas collagenimarina]MDP4535797.1 hypothetical protein [Alkalimonas collagenimarina]